MLDISVVRREPVEFMRKLPYIKFILHGICLIVLGIFVGCSAESDPQQIAVTREVIRDVGQVTTIQEYSCSEESLSASVNVYVGEPQRYRVVLSDLPADESLIIRLTTLRTEEKVTQEIKPFAKSDENGDFENSFKASESFDWRRDDWQMQIIYSEGVLCVEPHEISQLMGRGGSLATSANIFSTCVRQIGKLNVRWYGVIESWRVVYSRLAM